MSAIWTEADWDDHELVEVVHDRASGLTAIIALHSTHLGPAAGGTRFWHYADPAGAMRDALRLSRGMSFKNAMAGLPIGGGKAVVLLDKNGKKTRAMLSAFGDAVEALNGRYVTAEDVGASEADMVAIAERTAHVCGLPAAEGDAGGNPGPFTAMGIYLGIKAAVAHKLGKDAMQGVRVAVQGCGSVGGGVARLLAKDGADLVLADIDAGRAQALASETGGKAVAVEQILNTACDVFSPNALGAILNDEGIARLDCAIVAGGANNQLARREHGRLLDDRGILYAPDYVINAGGIINVSMEYISRQRGEASDINEVRKRIAQIPGRLQQIWETSDAESRPPHEVADAMAMELIGRG
ncbi:leucine dehydrogenase [Aurantiacibacter atlanticus]|uniref:Leucine dehydrogenase n=1 Tax=Aurantiacibacter atlanticus TaxID=1648404 RepID=A0A0H4VY62_9SPHN|nr:Glu/Leu/Phe/Val dehydrogenase dimerization domain-containing protein [Aurantiacibacter atlanticus]AKQ42078.1 leucine dehydrogenase [Aurantiacibacter atlanticus]MDF1834570.1 Glu/Leu/Phe/Val dehydrogenase dimerization domain-containing protein [Alteraurantiacibacter sp. bin_em_oilr2.035]